MMTKLKRLCRAAGISLAQIALMLIAAVLVLGLAGLPFWLVHRCGVLASLGCFLAYIVIVATAVNYSQLAKWDRGDRR